MRRHGLSAEELAAADPGDWRRYRNPICNGESIEVSTLRLRSATLRANGAGMASKKQLTARAERSRAAAESKSTAYTGSGLRLRFATLRPNGVEGT